MKKVDDWETIYRSARELLIVHAIAHKMGEITDADLIHAARLFLVAVERVMPLENAHE